jgi:hypothetical protein
MAPSSVSPRSYARVVAKRPLAALGSGRRPIRQPLHVASAQDFTSLPLPSAANSIVSVVKSLDSGLCRAQKVADHYRNDVKWLTKKLKPHHLASYRSKQAAPQGDFASFKLCLAANRRSRERQTAREVLLKGEFTTKCRQQRLAIPGLAT